MTNETTNPGERRPMLPKRQAGDPAEDGAATEAPAKNASAKRVISFVGPLTILEASDIRDRLLAAIGDTPDQPSAIEIDCEAAEEVDITFLQLLIAASKSARAAGKLLAIGSRSDAMGEALLRVGLAAPDRSNESAWLGEDIVDQMRALA